ncbi:MAG: deoxyribonuclease V [Candidatus Bathyarchaeia archaeon]|nr:deoxyribonuclease V [Candidatus Bathyarchaeota archaeon]
MPEVSDIRLPLNINFSLEKARKTQIILSKMVIREDRINTPIRYVAGIDLAYTDKYSIGAAAVLSYEDLKPIEVKLAVTEVKFPYIPTLLSFREMPAAAAAIKRLETKPDVFLVDGQGLAHPYRLGFASHLGVTLNIPTIGVAKKLLCGEILKGDGLWRPIIYEGEVVGGAVYTKREAKPVYVSIGHRVSLETAIKIVLDCTKGHRIPEPLRIAHIHAKKAKRDYLSKHNSSFRFSGEGWNGHPS